MLKILTANIFSTFLVQNGLMCIDVDENFDQTDKDDDALLYLMHFLEI